MTTFALSDFRPAITSRLFWIRTNRLLAWALVLAAPLELAFNIRFSTSFLIDLAILVVHGGLSLMLFGAPRTKERDFSPAMHVFGWRKRGISARNRFLLSGYRIGLAVVVWPMALVSPALLLVALYPLLRLPVTLIGHVHGACTYAFARWGMRSGADDAAVVIAASYFMLSFYNMVR